MSLVNNLLSVIFPQRCLVCGSKSRYLLCDRCVSKLTVDFNRCSLCSRPINTKKGICISCLKNDNSFSKGFALFNYRDGISDKIVELIKFCGYVRLVNVISYFSESIKNSRVFHEVDCLVPVPMHKYDLKKRGFNQSVFIAKKLSKIVDVKVCYDCIEKVRFTHTQVGLDAFKRRKNLEGAFKLLKDLKFNRVVVVDDVFTTGSTVNEICGLFKNINIDCNFFTLAATPQEN